MERVTGQLAGTAAVAAAAERAAPTGHQRLPPRPSRRGGEQRKWRRRTTEGLRDGGEGHGPSGSAPYQVPAARAPHGASGGGAADMETAATTEGLCDGGSDQDGGSGDAALGCQSIRMGTDECDSATALEKAPPRLRRWPH
jgi:hypothetical protein